MSSGVDYPLEETIQFLFTTRSFSTGAPTQLAGTPVVSIYEDDNLTQITAGVTLSVDHDSVTGLNRVAVVATAANGYESGKSYHLVITTGTVGGVSVVGEVVGHFTINRAAALRPTTAGRTLDVAATGEAGVDLDNTSGTLAAAQIATDAITADKIAADAIGSSELATTAVNEIRDAILSDSTAFAGANVDAAISSRATPAQVNTEVDTALADVNLDHLVGTATGIPAMPAGVFLDQIMRQAAGAFDRETDSLQAIRDTAPLGTAMRGTDSAALAANYTAGRATNLDNLDALVSSRMAEASISTTGGAVDTVTDVTNLHADAGTAANQTAIAARLPATLSSGRMRSDVEALNGVAASAANLERSASTIVQGTVDTTAFTPTTTEFEADDITEATADHFNGRIVIFTSGALVNQGTDITDYALTGGRGHFTVTALTEAPGNNDTFVIV